jgi:hypothetical protein
VILVRALVATLVLAGEVFAQPAAAPLPEESLPTPRRVFDLVRGLGGRVQFRDPMSRATFTPLTITPEQWDQFAVRGTTLIGVRLSPEDQTGRMHDFACTAEQLELLGRAASLEWLDFGAKCSPKDLAELCGRFDGLKSLSLRLDKSVIEDDLQFLEKLDSLESLSVASDSKRLTGRFVSLVPATAPLKSVTLGGTEVGFALSVPSLQEIGRRASLRELSIFSPRLSSTHLDRIGAMTQLEALLIAPADPTGLRRLRKLQSLTRLSLHDQQLGSPTIQAIDPLSGVVDLRFSTCQFGNGALAALSKLNRIERLEFHLCHWNHAEFRSLGQLQYLKSLAVSVPVADSTDPKAKRTVVTDADFATFAGLESLTITCDDLTGRCLDHLSGLDKLTSLSIVSNGRITSEDCRALQSQIKQCRIQVSGGSGPAVFLLPR